MQENDFPYCCGHVWTTKGERRLLPATLDRVASHEVCICESGALNSVGVVWSNGQGLVRKQLTTLVSPIFKGVIYRSPFSLHHSLSLPSPLSSSLLLLSSSATAFHSASTVKLRQ